MKQYDFDGLFRSKIIRGSTSDETPTPPPEPREGSKSLARKSRLSTPKSKGASKALTNGFEEIPQAASIPVLWRQPKLDERTYDLALLASLRTIVYTSPANTIMWHYIELLPQITDYLQHLFLSKESNRSSTIAMLTILRDMLTTCQPSHLHFQHKARSLRLLQQDINEGVVDEALCFSIISHISIERCVGDTEAMWKHVNGVNLAFRRL